MKNWILLLTLLFSGFVNAADMPSQGMSMSKVQHAFGSPVKKAHAVGKPPITRWIYPEYTVVFEYKHVVQSVRMLDEQKAAPAPTTEPAPVAPNEATISVEVKE